MAIFYRWRGGCYWNTRPKKSLRRAWRAACARAGLPGRPLHHFRRTALRNLDRAAVGRKVARALVGMKTDPIYRRYEIVTEADLADGKAPRSWLKRTSHPEFTPADSFPAWMR